MSDLIDRQAAIDALKEAFNPSITNFVKAKMAIDNLPSAEPEKRTEERAETHACDCISRQAAIDAVYKCADIFAGDMPIMVVKSDAYEALAQLPSAQPEVLACGEGELIAQPEIIHCGECKHRDPEDHKCDCGHDIIWQLPRGDKWYCADAERRTDERQT